jgi:hypothetical protein
VRENLAANSSTPHTSFLRCCSIVLTQRSCGIQERAGLGCTACVTVAVSAST